MTAHRVVTFLTDFGRADTFVGVCHGVIAALAPDVRVIDLTHDVPPHDVGTGAWLLARAVPSLPVSVHLAVVDPGVGTDREGVALATRRGDVLVGPDNGLLRPAAEALGGVIAAFRLPRPQGDAVTFDGRDVFAPAAARIAIGVPPAELGPLHLDLVPLEVPTVDVQPGAVRARVTVIDRFGNAQLGARPADARTAGVGQALRVTMAGRAIPARLVRTFADLGHGEVGLIADSDGYLAVVLDRDDAAATYGLAPGDEVLIEPLHGGTGPSAGPPSASA